MSCAYNNPLEVADILVNCILPRLHRASVIVLSCTTSKLRQLCQPRLEAEQRTIDALRDGKARRRYMQLDLLRHPAPIHYLKWFEKELNYLVFPSDSSSKNAELDFEWSKFMSYAAEVRNIELLHTYLPQLRGARKHCFALKAACLAGHLDVIVYLLEHGSLWGDYCTAAAASGGHKHVIEFALAKYGVPSPRFSELSMVECASEGGHVELVRWLHNTYNISVQDQDSLDRWVKLDMRRLSVAAARHNNLEVLRWAHKKGFRVCPAVALAAARAGSLEILRWIYTVNPPVLECGNPVWADVLWYSLLSQAARAGSVACLQFLRTLGWTWRIPHDKCCSVAAKSGALAALQYLIANGCPYDCNSTVISAIKKERFEVLDWMFDNHKLQIDYCEAGPRFYTFAPTVAMVLYLRDVREIPGLDVATLCSAAALRGNFSIVKWCFTQEGHSAICVDSAFAPIHSRLSGEQVAAAKKLACAKRGARHHLTAKEELAIKRIKK